MWDKYTIEKDKTYHWNLGKTAIWVRKIDKEWFIWNKNINQTYNQSTLEYDSEPPEGVELHRKPV